jgi:2-C-methyl-D-erythritol 4-phosphate cytidylyltransferase
MVHDAVRCLVTVELIRRCYEAAIIHGSAIPSVQPHDSVRLLTETGHTVLNRTNLRLIQTPQVFKGQILKSSFQASYQEKFTDEASVVEAAGHSIHLIEGEENNIKITTHRDHLLAETLI